MSLAVPKSFLIDWRGQWSRLDRARACQRASVANTWTTNPFGLRPVETLVAVQPGILRWEGRPTGSPTSFNATLGKHADLDGWGKLNEDHGINLWLEGPQSVTAIDIADPVIAIDWTQHILDHFGWAKGLHIDYFTTLAWIDNTFPADYWRRWNEGLVLAVDTLRQARPDWIILGQQYRLSSITHVLDGLFIEQSPGHFGVSFDQHALAMKTHGKPENWCFELRHPETFPAWYVQQVIDFVRDHGAYLAYGRDASALKGMP